jgi:hypothetical protein
LHDALAELIQEASTHVLFLFAGLGTLQLDHPAAAPLPGALKASLDSPFPATTTVSLATIATGLAPSQHGLLGYQLWFPEVDQVVNTIKSGRRFETKAYDPMDDSCPMDEPKPLRTW